MMIERDITLTQPPEPDIIDVHPFGIGSQCEHMMNAHAFFIVAKACGLQYSICGKCGTVRIAEKR